MKLPHRLVVLICSLISLAFIYSRLFRSPDDIRFFSYSYKFRQVMGNLWVYSAYYDDIAFPDSPKIRVIVIDKPNQQHTFACHFYDKNQAFLYSAVGAKFESSDPLEAPVASFHFVLCDVKEDRTFPAFVALKVLSSVDHSDPAQTEVRLPIPKPGNKIHPIRAYVSNNNYHYKYRLAACVQPLHSRFERPLELVEWIEFHKLMGVEQFVFYNHSAKPFSSLVLNSYIADGIASIQEWNLPNGGYGSKIWGQFAAASDCSHKLRGIVKYVTTFDTDEFLIVPENYQGFYDYFESRIKNRDPGLLFRSKFNFRNFPADTEAADAAEMSEIEKRLYIPNRTKFFPGWIFKFIYRPDYVIRSGVHGIELFVKGKTSEWVDRSEAYYFHYRTCDFFFNKPNHIVEGQRTCNSTDGVQHETNVRRRFGKAIRKAVMKKLDSDPSLKAAIELYYEKQERRNGK